ARRNRIVLRFNRPLGEEKQFGGIFNRKHFLFVDWLEWAAEGIDRIPTELTAMLRVPMPFNLRKMEKSEREMGHVHLHDSVAGASVGLSVFLQFDNPKEELWGTISHELLHKLSVLPNPSGTDLNFPVRDWIDMIETNGFRHAMIFDREYVRKNW